MRGGSSVVTLRHSGARVITPRSHETSQSPFSFHAALVRVRQNQTAFGSGA